MISDEETACHAWSALASDWPSPRNLSIGRCVNRACCSCRSRALSKRSARPQLTQPMNSAPTRHSLPWVRTPPPMECLLLAVRTPSPPPASASPASLCPADAKRLDVLPRAPASVVLRVGSEGPQTPRAV
eukprot:1853146-Rhodomonas_salina.2